MNCPRCRHPGIEVIEDEVDIGVGVQKFVRGYDCPDCGEIMVCDACGHVEGAHWPWCGQMKLNQTEENL